MGTVATPAVKVIFGDPGAPKLTVAPVGKVLSVNVAP